MIDRVPAEIANSGFEWAREQADGFIDLVGPFWSRNADDIFIIAFVAEDKHRNRRGVVQGGMLATLADRGMGQASRNANANKPQATIQLDVRYLNAARIGGLIEARCRVDRRTRQLTFVSAEILADGALVAQAQGIWKILGTGRGGGT